jgi:hypothetical protein
MPPVSVWRNHRQKKTLMAAVERAYQRLCCDIFSAPELCWQFGYSVFMPVVMGCFKCLKKYSKNNFLAGGGSRG